MSERLKNLTQKEVTMYRLQDGSLVSNLELPNNLLRDMPVVCTARMVRKTPLHPWRLDEGSVKMPDTST